MAELQKKRLQDLLNRQHQRLQELAAIKAKTDLRSNMPFFDVKYRFADEEETGRIEAILDGLSYKLPGRIDTAALSGTKVDKPTYQGQAWICFLGGSETLLHIFIHGRIDDILRDIDDWQALSHAILLLLGDYRHLIFLDDDGSITEAEIPSTDNSAAT